MENYIIKAGATAEYILLENSSKDTAKFIAEMEWKKIFLHNIEWENAWISQYEKYSKYKIPIILLEKEEEIIEEKQNIEEDIMEEIIEKKEYIKKEYLPYIAFWITSIIFLIIWIDNQFTKSNIQEVKKTPIIEEKTIFETLTDRIIILEKKENLEFEKQKRLRKEIEESISTVKQIRKEKEEIWKQKIELAQ